MNRLSAYAFQNPDYLPQFLEAFLPFLNPAKIPKTFNKDTLEPFESAVWALKGLIRLGVTERPISDEQHQRALAVLEGPWAGIWKWVDYSTDKCFL